MDSLTLILEEARHVEQHIQATLSLSVVVDQYAGATKGLSADQDLLLRSMAAVTLNARSKGADQEALTSFLRMAHTLKLSVSKTAEQRKLTDVLIVPWDEPVYYRLNAVQELLRTLDKATGASTLKGFIKLGVAVALVWAVSETVESLRVFLSAVAAMIFVMAMLMARVRGKELAFASIVFCGAIAYGAAWFALHGATPNAVGICGVGGLFTGLYLLIGSGQKVDPTLGQASPCLYSEPARDPARQGDHPNDPLRINPVNGLPMAGLVDIEGNPYGIDADSSSQRPGI